MSRSNFLFLLLMLELGTYLHCGNAMKLKYELSHSHCFLMGQPAFPFGMAQDDRWHPSGQVITISLQCCLYASSSCSTKCTCKFSQIKILCGYQRDLKRFVFVYTVGWWVGEFWIFTLIWCFTQRIKLERVHKLLLKKDCDLIKSSCFYSVWKMWEANQNCFTWPWTAPGMLQ